MTLYSPWNKCERCDRAKYRWGIFAPAGTNPRVVVLGATASRASQSIGQPDPLPAQIAVAIADTYGLGPKDLHVDVLLACGASGAARAHEAAACAQRIEDQAQLGAWPVELVVLVGEYTARLARYAGLVTAAGFRLGGQLRPCVVIQDVGDIGIDAAWVTLGKPPIRSGGPTLYPLATPVLTEILRDRCSGHLWRPRGGQWARFKGRPTPDLVEAHVEGQGWLSPDRPVGAWPYCVLDVDLHNAIQYKTYDDTLSELTTEHFKKSLVFKSSPSGGAHVYVRLPPDTTYADAAVWLAEFLFLHGLLFQTSPPNPSATARGTVATRLVEVPFHPPRLPFGLGSALRGFPVPDEAVRRFDKWLDAPDASDFEAARAHVMSKGKHKKQKRWPERAAWVRTYVHELELEALKKIGKKNKTLDPGDPWLPYMSRLAPNVAALVTDGCLAFGTRTATMTRLADALAEIVEPDLARSLLRYWVEHREHRSEDIHVAKEEVLASADRLIEATFEGRGVPACMWAKADAAVKNMYASIALGQTAPLKLKEEECRRAAFHVLRLFYMKGERETFIAAEQFGLALEKGNIGGLPVQRPNQNRVEDVRVAMKQVLITQTRAPDYLTGKAGEYKLHHNFWPPPPSGEPLVFQPT